MSVPLSDEAFAELAEKWLLLRRHTRDAQAEQEAAERAFREIDNVLWAEIRSLGTALGQSRPRVARVAMGYAFVWGMDGLTAYFVASNDGSTADAAAGKGGAL